MEFALFRAFALLPFLSSLSFSKDPGYPCSLADVLRRGGVRQVREMVSLSVLACFTPRHHLPSGVMLWPPDEVEMEVEVKLDIVCRGWDGSKRLESDHDEPVVSFLFLTTTPVPVLGIVICVFHSRVDTMPSLLLSSHFLFFHGATPLLSLVRLVRCSVAIGPSFPLEAHFSFQLR
jgi:hypothetical protein